MYISAVVTWNISSFWT